MIEQKQGAIKRMDILLQLIMRRWVCIYGCAAFLGESFLRRWDPQELLVFKLH